MRRFTGILPLVSLVGWAGCSSSDQPDAKVEVEEGRPQGELLSDEDLASGASGASAADRDQPTCQGETRAAEAIGLDIFVMLDSSGSMNVEVPGISIFPISKWEAVQASLREFVEAPETEGIGVGLQFFPQINANVPLTCDTNADCGAGGGACTSSVCVRIDSLPVQGPDLQYIGAIDNDAPPCLADSECPGGELCRPILGTCVLQPGAVPEVPDGSPLPLGPDTPIFCGSAADCAQLAPTVCEPLGICSVPVDGQPFPCWPSFPCPAGAGVCTTPDFGCTGQTRCDVADYSTPAVPITSDASRATAVRSALARRTPAGLTPTGPALQGAIEYATSWADQHPDRQVVTVLATDGFPEGFCSPEAIPQIAAVAQAANTGERPIRTFVVGVFASADLAQGRQQDLDQIARAGGSQQAVVINTAGDVTQDFLAALNRIRDTSVSCEFKLTGDRLDFDQVNLEVVDAMGSNQLLNVSDLAGCGTDQEGWFYERDAAGTPTQISVCPSTCRHFQAGGVSANLQIGCATRIR